jgi:hypothetical protein
MILSLFQGKISLFPGPQFGRTSSIRLAAIAMAKAGQIGFQVRLRRRMKKRGKKNISGIVISAF